jgi:hypothetical protein
MKRTKSVEANHIQFGREHEEVKKDYQKETKIIFVTEMSRLDDIFVVISLE